MKIRESVSGNLIIEDTEHMHTNIHGIKCMPCFDIKIKSWYIGNRILTLTELGDLCNIDKESLLFLKIKYGG